LLLGKEQPCSFRKPRKRLKHYFLNFVISSWSEGIMLNFLMGLKIESYLR